jgi:glyoxylase-like metal-dependent hydrolase (beta-lactamase superfamily II)
MTPEQGGAMRGWKAWALRTGNSRAEQSMLTYLTGAGQEVVIPHIMILLQGESTVLIDTGFGSPAEIAANYPQELWRSDSEQPEALLAELGVAPADVDLVIHTHLHYDHVGNNHLFPGATKLAQASELDFFANPDVPLMRREYFTPCCGFPAQFDVEDVTSVDGDKTLLPGLELLALPGHTPGSQGVLFETASGPLCFAGDLVMVTENMNEMTPVGLHTDLAAAESSRRKLKSLGAAVIPSHDMRLFSEGTIQALTP